MRIAIDINGITERSGGVGNYVRLLVQELAAIDRRNEYLLYLHHWRAIDGAALRRVVPQQPNFQLVFHRMPNSVALFSEYKLGFRLTEALLKRRAIDVFHGPVNIVPRFKSMRSVLTLHHYKMDSFLPRDLGARGRLYFEVSAQAAAAADRIITVSEATKKTIVQELGIPSEKCTVVYPGGPHPVHRTLPGVALPPALAERLPGRYILFPGPLNLRKNLPMLLEAFASVQDRLGGYRIAVTGQPSAAYAAAILALAQRLGLGANVVLLGEVSMEEMARLYNRAEFLAYPSLYEGFGSPPLEAMACGCPVMASGTTAIPEVVGDAALLFDPANREAVAQALLRMTGDPALRRDLAAKGLERVKRFSWRRMAEAILEIYRQAGS